MQKRKQFTLGIITLLLLCILAGCQFGNQKKKTEKKVDYYIGVVDNNAPYYYKDADGTEKAFKRTVVYLYVCSDGYFCFRTKSFRTIC